MSSPAANVTKATDSAGSTTTAASLTKPSETTSTALTTEKPVANTALNASATATAAAGNPTASATAAADIANVKTGVETETLSQANAAANTPAKKFPKFITDNLIFEAAPPSAKDTKENAAYEEGQRQDYLKALRYLEAELLTLAPKAWTAEKIMTVLKDLYKITCHTLLTHRFNALDEESFSGFRTAEIETLRETPPETPGLVLKNYRYNFRTVEKTAEVFHILASGYDRNVALNFIKFYIKWMRLSAADLQILDALLDEKLLDLSAKTDTSSNIFASFKALERVQAELPEWRKANFGRLDTWLEAEFTAKPEFRFPPGLIDDEWMALRANEPGLYSAAELAARDRVVKFYPLAKELPAKMLALAQTLVAKIKASEDPIAIAAYVHQEIAVENHPYLNGNHRIARMMMNTVLVSFGLPAVDFKADLDRRAYYKASEKGEKNPRVFEDFVREAVSKQLANDTCVAARDGNVKRLSYLIERLGASVDRPANPKNGWTPLHFACRQGQIGAAGYLVGKGASLKPKQLPTVKLKEPLEMLANATDKATLLELASKAAKATAKK